MTNISRNVVNDVLKSIECCTQKQKTLARFQARHEEAVTLKLLVEDMLKEIEIDLCNLAASFITAPMSGRLFIPLPSEFVDEKVAQESLVAQLRAQ